MSRSRRIHSIIGQGTWRRLQALRDSCTPSSRCRGGRRQVLNWISDPWKLSKDGLHHGSEPVGLFFFGFHIPGSDIIGAAKDNPSVGDAINSEKINTLTKTITDSSGFVAGDATGARNSLFIVSDEEKKPLLRPTTLVDERIHAQWGSQRRRPTCRLRARCNEVHHKASGLSITNSQRGAASGDPPEGELVCIADGEESIDRGSEIIFRKPKLFKISLNYE